MMKGIVKAVFIFILRMRLESNLACGDIWQQTHLN